MRALVILLEILERILRLRTEIIVRPDTNNPGRDNKPPNDCTTAGTAAG